MSFNLVQYLNASIPILVTPSRIVTFSNLEHLSNAQKLILVAPCGIVTFFRLEHPQNIYGPISGVFSGSITTPSAGVSPEIVTLDNLLHSLNI